MLRTDTAREGRTHQLYAADGRRVVAGCVVLTRDRRQVVMVSSAKHRDRWIIPKGGVELDERDSYLQAAQRETWEEAGCVGVVEKYLGEVQDTRDKCPPEAPRCEFHFYQLLLQELSPAWPEQHRRHRACFDYATARRHLQLARRPELLDALERSDIVKD